MENNSSVFHEEQKRSVLYGFTGALLSAVSRRAAGHQHIYYPPAATGTLQLSRGNMKAPNNTNILDSSALTAQTLCAPWKQRAHVKLTGYLSWPDRWSSVQFSSLSILQNPEGMDIMQWMSGWTELKWVTELELYLSTRETLEQQSTQTHADIKRRWKK